MFTFNELKSIHLEITNNCQARCPMCSRNQHGGEVNPNLKMSDWSLQDFKDIITTEVAQQVNHIYFCGNFGDPLLNNDLLEMCEYLTSQNSQLKVRIHTNGGARKVEWWEKLATVLPKDHAVIFGIDGLEDTHHLYRIGTTYDNVVKNAQAFINAGGIAEWVFIKFKHNEHQVQEAERRAKEYGFRQFTVKNTNRFIDGVEFDVRDLKGNVIYKLQPPTDNVVKFIDKSVIEKIDDWVSNSTIECKAQQENEIYIDAHRDVFPCCFLASAPYYHVEPTSAVLGVKKRIVEEHETLLKDIGIIHASISRSVKDIIQSSEWQDVWYTSWENKKLLTCSRICGVSNTKLFSKPSDQFIKRVNLDE